MSIRSYFYPIAGMLLMGFAVVAGARSCEMQDDRITTAYQLGKCVEAEVAEEVYERCMADPDCRMSGTDRKAYIEQKTNWLVHKCEIHPSNQESED